MKELSIVYTCKENIRYWGADPIWLHSGEKAKIVGVLIDDSVNPLYNVRRDSDGDEKPIPQLILLSYGTIEGVT